MSLTAISLQSGSSGNCIYVEAGGVRLLFDAGISGIQAQRRLASFGIDIRAVDALIISHDHSDHASHAGVYRRKYGIPVFMTRATFETASGCHNIGRPEDVRFFRSGGTLDFGRVSVKTVPTPHDGSDGSAFVVDTGESRLGILMDLGHVFEGLGGLISSLDAVFIESNYDPDMLERGPYPAFLKRRIKGPGGHISNIEAAVLLKESASRGLKWACLAHLSETNNTPEAALCTHRKIAGPGFPVHAASRYEPTGILRV